MDICFPQKDIHYNFFLQGSGPEDPNWENYVVGDRHV